MASTPLIVKYDPQAQAKSRLLTLPLELRYHIYACLLNSNPPRLHAFPTSSKAGVGKNIIDGDNPLHLSNSWFGRGNDDGIPSILRICKQIFSEIQSLFFENLLMFMNRKTYQSYDYAATRADQSHAWLDGVIQHDQEHVSRIPAGLSNFAASSILSRRYIFSHLQSLVVLYKSASQGDVSIRPYSTAKLTAQLRRHFPNLRTLVLRRVYEVNVDYLYTPELGRVTRSNYEEFSIRRKVILWRQAMFLDWPLVMHGKSGRLSATSQIPPRARLMMAINRASQIERDPSEQDGGMENGITHSVTEGNTIPEHIEVIYEGEMRVLYGQSWAQEHVETFVYTFPNIAESGVYNRIDDIISSTARLVADEERQQRVQEMSERHSGQTASSRSLWP